MAEFNVAAFVAELQGMGVKLTAVRLADGKLRVNRWRMLEAIENAERIAGLWAEFVGDDQGRLDLVATHLIAAQQRAPAMSPLPRAAQVPPAAADVALRASGAQGTAAAMPAKSPVPSQLASLRPFATLARPAAVETPKTPVLQKQDGVQKVATTLPRPPASLPRPVAALSKSPTPLQNSATASTKLASDVPRPAASPKSPPVALQKSLHKPAAPFSSSGGLAKPAVAPPVHPSVLQGAKAPLEKVPFVGHKAKASPGT